MLKSIVAQLGAQPSATTAAYTARYLHSKELEPFTRMMTQMDAATTQAIHDGPRFFSAMLRALDACSIAWNRSPSQYMTTGRARRSRSSIG